jgi:serine phosphatase RsbU (regulator of sigma subunit)
LRQQNKEIEHKNKEITDSIFYAKKIQEAIMPSSSFINELFPESFVLFKPKDIVSGDFYWATQKNNKILIAAADCTGHGVPGAFMSMLGNDNLNEIVIDRNTLEPNEILNGARLGIIKALKQKGESGENKDGMDIAMLVYDRENLKLEYSGANNPLYIIRKNSHSPFLGYSYNIVQDRYSLLEIKGNKFPVGIYINNELPPFTSHTLQLEKGDTFYIFSDGFADQFGGEAGKKFKYNKLKELLLSIQELPLPEQSRVLEDTFYNWKGNLEQVDDVLLIGMRVN